MTEKYPQMELDFSIFPDTFSKKIWWNKTTTVRWKIQEITEKITNKDIFLEAITINGMPYEFKISYKIKGNPYIYSNENNKVSNIIFLLKQWENAGHKFQVSISNYRIKQWQIGWIRFWSICKIDPRNWWVNYADRNGLPIQHFNYFKRLFSWTWAHDPIVKSIEKAIREIHIREGAVL